MAAKNYKGEESEQSRERSGANADEYAKGSVKRASQEKKRDATTKKSALDRIMREGGMIQPTRQKNPPQTGRSNMNHDEE